MTAAPPKLHVLADVDAVGRRVAGIVVEHLAQHAGGSPVLGLATGETFRPVYRHLVAAVRAGRASFAGATSFALDEYRGLGPEDPRSFQAYLRQHLFDHVDADPGRTHHLQGAAPDAVAETARYEALIRAAGGIGLQLLGLGRNGHIAFNEPGSAFASRTREVALAPATRQANAATFGPGRDVPERALTTGIGTILEARRILVVATGGAKRAALEAALRGPVTPDCPASALRLHSAVTILADQDAAGTLAAAA